MKDSEKKNKIFGFLSGKNVKKFVLIMYLTVPLFVFAVGFSAWTIIGHQIDGNGASGSFVADGIINSYDYVTPGSGINSLQLFPTGFIDGDGNVKSSATIEITHTLHNAGCKKLVENNSDKTLYADFTLMFSNGNEYKAFFNNLSCEISAKDTAGNTVDLSALSGVTITRTNTTASYKTCVTFNPDNLYDGNITLTFKYTVSPSAADYLTIYNEMVKRDLTPMIDIRITDVNPAAN